MEDIIIPFIVAVPVIGLPWLILHYVTKWKSNAGLTAEDENLLDDLYQLARRLDDRMTNLERILAAENPNWNGLGYDRPTPQLEKRTATDDLSDLERRMDRLSSERSSIGRA